MPKPFHWLQSIRFKTIVPMFLALIIAIGTITLAVVGVSRSTTERVLGVLKEEVVLRLSENVEESLKSAVDSLMLHLYSMDGQLLDLDDPALRERYFVAALKKSDRFAMTYIGRPDGSFYGARRLVDGTLEIVKNNSDTKGHSEYYSIDETGKANALSQVFENFDPRTRPWYTQAADSNSLSFTPLYSHFVFKEPTTTVSVPYYRGDTFIGVFGIDLLVTDLSDILKTLPIGEDGRVFLTDASGNLVANNFDEPIFRTDGGMAVPVHVTDSSHPIIRRTVDRPLVQGTLERLTIGDTTYLLSGHPIAAQGLDWVLYVLVDQEDYLGDFDRTIRGVIISGGLITLLFLVLLLRMNTHFIEPIISLEKSAAALTEGHFEEVSRSRGNDELGHFIENFNEMGRRLVDQMTYLKEEVQRQTTKLEFAVQDAENANRAKTRFLATMSHELRTPMNGIVGVFQLLRTTELTEEQADYVRMGDASGQTLLRLISEVLDYSKIEAEKITLDLHAFSTEDLVHEITGYMRAHAEVNDNQASQSIDSSVPSHVYGDSFRIKQVLINLLSNASKFAQKGTVDFILSPAADPEDPTSQGLLFQVVDSGIGIAEDKKKEIFEPFVQADQDTTRKYGGTGLGLAISKELVALMQGRLWFESKAGEGTTFSLWLPLQAVEAPRDRTSDAPPSTVASPSRLRILLAEDDPINISLMEKFAAKESWDLTVAKDGEEALDYYRRHTYDLLLLDLQMPKKDGLEVCRAIREMEKGSDRILPIIGLSANALNGDEENALASGMDDYLSKPFQIDELRRKIAHLIQQDANQES